MAAAAALASSAPGRGSDSSMPPPLKAPPYSKPPPPDLPSGPPIKAVPTSKLQPPTPSTLGPSPSGVQDAGGRLYARGPDLGGALTPESSAGSAFTSYHMPVGPVGKSIAMKRAAGKDRPLQSFPRSAFQFLPDEDPPILRVLAGPDGPGWFPKLWQGEQWSGMLFPLDVSLPAFDYVHRVSAKTPSDMRRLMLSQVDYLRFAVRIAAGEYVPYELAEMHGALQTRAIVEVRAV